MYMGEVLKVALEFWFFFFFFFKTLAESQLIKR